MEKKFNFAPYVIIMFFVGIIVIVCALTNYKSEKLVCSRTDDICSVERINLLGQKSIKKLSKFSEVEGVSYYRQRVKGNRYGKGYKEYLLSLSLKNGKELQVFSKSYYDKKELNEALSRIRKMINDDSSELIYSRD